MDEPMNQPASDDNTADDMDKKDEGMDMPKEDGMDKEGDDKDMGEQA